MFSKYLNEYKEEFKKSIEELKQKETFYKQIPNLLTFIRLVGAIPAGLMYYLNPTFSLWAIAILWFTDTIDGKIARKFNLQSKLGADMDAVADKIMFLGSALPLLGGAPGLILNFILEGIISGINVAGRMKGLNTKTVFSGKVKTVSLAITLVLGYLAQFLGFPTFIFNLLRGVTTVCQFVAIKDYIINFVKMSKEQEKNVEQEDVIEILEPENKEEDSLIEQLKREKEFLLSTKEPDKVSKPYRRFRSLRDVFKKNN